MAPYVDTLHLSRAEEVNAVVAAPPQHGKTVLTQAEIIQRLLSGTGRSAYVTYNQTRADKVSLLTQWAADGAGIPWEGARRDWYHPGGGSIVWTSIGGPFTGEPVDDLLIIDDPFKDYAEASSGHRRDVVWDWWLSVAMARIHPGASVIVIATRWHEDDMSGRFIEEGWPYVNLQAISDDTGAYLWPSKRTPEWYEKRRRKVTEHFWSAQYQGRPTPRGDAIFGEPTYYSALPRAGLKWGHGVDLAYTARTTADHSVCVTGTRGHDGTLYLVDVVRKQVDAPSFMLSLMAQHTAHPGPMLFRCSGTEKGAASFIQRRLRSFRTQQVRGDKLVSSQEYAAAWNAGKVQLPEGAPWVSDFLTEHHRFTGVSDAHDDQVDAAGSLFTVLSMGRAGSLRDKERRRRIPKRRM
jgi:predicted phage terminase large subunit-like protein